MSDDIEQTIVQSLVDDQKRGRVLSIFIMARRGIESLGSRLFGIVANWVGTPDAPGHRRHCLFEMAAFATKLLIDPQRKRPFEEILPKHRRTTRDLRQPTTNSGPRRPLARAFPQTSSAKT
jgi:hypothetical protein